MCGVVSIVYRTTNPLLGKEASALLRKLEYRGYDSTGAAFFTPDGKVALKKKVGAPSFVIRALGLESHQGHQFIGQVRWATYGSVTDINAQPHEVQCFCHLVGAHNGNISNTDRLKGFLAEQGHRVLSDNDGEMLVHLVEHYYDEAARRQPPGSDGERVATMIQAIRRAQHQVVGSYAACIAQPDLPGVFAMKSGSSLYAGKGSDGCGDFIVVSSDLTSVLSKTRFLIPLVEGQGIYFTHDEYRVFSLDEEREEHPKLTRSRLNIADITLQARYRYFMHQEIYTAAQNLDRILKYYFMERREEGLFRVFEQNGQACQDIVFDLLKLYDIFDRTELKRALDSILAGEGFGRVLDDARQAQVEWPEPTAVRTFTSDEAQLFEELLGFGEDYFQRLWLFDQIIIWKKKRKITHYRDELSRLIRTAAENGGRVFFIGAGTSYHASLVGAYLFNHIAGLAIIVANPGMFRSMYLNSLKKEDVLVGVTQSGETKDLLDIFNDVRKRHGTTIRLVSMVNNELSTIPQEKSDFFLPILCGPEVAVAATKSFISQIALFHLLACNAVMPTAEVKEEIAKVKTVLDFTLKDVEEDTTEVALKLFLKPSIHVLATSLVGLAKEGALKIREVVLNHTQGYDSAEFKHGPNTILGKNTIFSLAEMERLLHDVLEFFDELLVRKFNERSGGLEKLEDLVGMFKDIGFREFRLDERLKEVDEGSPLGAFHDAFRERIDLKRYFTNYPLIFICPPNERDINITVTQIHTHKIRGADIILIAQENEDLKRSIEGVPASVTDYYFKQIKVPKMFGEHMFVYQAAIVMQLLAFKMSVDKMKYLNKNHVENHGVHPDVPKNVSKSITVD